MTDQWWPIEHGNLPAFQVKRPSYGSSIGGDYVRGSSTPGPLSAIQHLPNAVLKYQTNDDVRRSAVLGQALLYVQPAGYNSVRIEWDWPPEETHAWQEVALVRSMFGSPTTPNDGQTIFRSLRSAWETDGDLTVGPVIYDNELSGGFWYYYTLFFNISPQAPTLGDWVSGYSDWVQLPRHFQHDEHLFNGVPPYYQWVDENNSGFLKQFMNIFGFELDFTRQSIEFMQDMYHTDITPMPLLREIGNNFGSLDEQGVGEIRFRAAMSDLAERHSLRGTQKGLQQTIETVSKYDTDITKGKNMLLLPDDSAAFFSTGNWAGPHTDLVPKLTALPGTALDNCVAWNLVTLAKLPADTDIPGVGMTGILRLSSATAGRLMFTCGCGQISPAVLTLPEGSINQPGEYLPLTNGIPVGETGVYSFAVYIRLSSITTVATAQLLWFDASGRATGLIDVELGTPPSPPAGGLTTSTWSHHVVQGVAPAGTFYMVPGILINSRPSTAAFVDITGAMAFTVQEPGGRAVPLDSNLLVLGLAADNIGNPSDPGAPALFVGHPIGEPLKKGGS